MTGALWAVLHHCALCRRDMAGGSRANSILSLSLCDGGAQAHARATRYARTRVCMEGGCIVLLQRGKPRQSGGTAPIIVKHQNAAPYYRPRKNAHYRAAPCSITPRYTHKKGALKATYSVALQRKVSARGRHTHGGLASLVAV